jgi:hypothetical protein
LPVAPVLTIEIEQELDGRWLAEVPTVPGALPMDRRARRPRLGRML